MCFVMATMEKKKKKRSAIKVNVQRRRHSVSMISTVSGTFTVELSCDQKDRSRESAESVLSDNTTPL